MYVNLFVSNETEIEIGREEVHVSMETKFPFDSRICIKVKNVPAAGIKLALRIPAYAQSYQVCANGQQVEYQVEKGYAYLTLTEEIEVTVTFEAPAKFVRANPNVRADCGKTAIVKGPLVYCLEEADNGKNLSELFIPTDQKIEEVQSTLFGGIIQLVLKGKRMQETAWKEEELYAEHPVTLSDVILKAVPYAYWNNRGMGEMTVWVKELI